jgi:hypothetical protein
LKLSLRLYESVEKFVEPTDIPFYIVVPQKELSMFHDAFAKALASNKIKALPIFMSEEDVFDRCGKHVYEKATKMSGWYSQQVVKMCFSKLGIARKYMTLDSDIYFTKTFQTALLFQDEQIKTYWPLKVTKAKKNSMEPKLLVWFAKIKTIMGDKTEGVHYLVSHFGLWSSELLYELEKFVSKDFADLINIVPFEMQWYTNFLYTHHIKDLHGIHSLFSLPPETDEHKQTACMPTQGYPWHYGLMHVRDEAPYQNPCGSFKSAIKKLRHFKKYLSFYLFGDAFKL